ncbi:NAD(P)-binding protein [Halobacillus salinarum]|uniref:NAD(P)-binding protein n=1 Tax=Halobacillus salinarum TaxID=2932257 RepID=A0ABY4EJ76_9BACI|nr:NAD(P)-binding protein [Halobacillus salinarum]UOQ44512.1 NAD(P)-binding protein [Halobacillus salinarum]
MKIAIMGAGLSGLACAVTLEKHGYQADIFERRGMVGDRTVFAEGICSIFHPPIVDYIRFLSETYGLELRPTSNLYKIHIHSPNESATLEGNLGFINMRGKHPQSYDQQLAEQLKSPITFHHKASLEDMAKEYTHIIMATGDPLDTKKMQPFDTAYHATLLGAKIEGAFKRNEMHAWFNNAIAPKGMAYILPHSENEASLFLVYPQTPKNLTLDKDKLWNLLIPVVEKTLNQSITIVNKHSVEDFMIGKTAYPRIGNTLFTGNCFGCISPFIGFGEFSALLTGIYAAEDLCGISDYQKQTKKLYQKYHDSLTLRRAIEKLSNDQLDRVVKSLQSERVGKIITNPHFQVLKVLSRLLHPFHRET